MTMSNARDGGAYSGSQSARQGARPNGVNAEAQEGQGLHVRQKEYVRTTIGSKIICDGGLMINVQQKTELVLRFG